MLGERFWCVMSFIGSLYELNSGLLTLIYDFLRNLANSSYGLFIIYGSVFFMSIFAVYELVTFISTLAILIMQRGTKSSNSFESSSTYFDNSSTYSSSDFSFDSGSSSSSSSSNDSYNPDWGDDYTW